MTPTTVFQSIHEQLARVRTTYRRKEKSLYSHIVGSNNEGSIDEYRDAILNLDKQFSMSIVDELNTTKDVSILVIQAFGLRNEFETRWMEVIDSEWKTQIYRLVETETREGLRLSERTMLVSS